jgi:hypothetical protein
LYPERNYKKIETRRGKPRADERPFDQFCLVGKTPAFMVHLRTLSAYYPDPPNVVEEVVSFVDGSGLNPVVDRVLI